MAEFDPWVHRWTAKKWFEERKSWLWITTVQLFIIMQRNGRRMHPAETLFAQHTHDVWGDSCGCIVFN